MLLLLAAAAEVAELVHPTSFTPRHFTSPHTGWQRQATNRQTNPPYPLQHPPPSSHLCQLHAGQARHVDCLQHLKGVLVHLGGHGAQTSSSSSSGCQHTCICMLQLTCSTASPPPTGSHQPHMTTSGRDEVLHGARRPGTHVDHAVDRGRLSQPR
jgi:hypothetical protein